MLTKKSVLVERLAFARRAKRTKNLLQAPDSPSKGTEHVGGTPETAVPADGQRELAKATATDAMVMGWDRAIQKHAYENRISEDELRKVLDEATAYNDKADPPGRIHELEDYKHEKRGRSSLASRSSRPS